MLRRVCKLIVLVAVATFGFNQPAQAFMFFSKNVYSSPVEGVISKNGLPLKGLEVTRQLTSAGLDQGKQIDRALTDENGHFAFPEVSNRTLLSPDWMSANRHVGQQITLRYQDRNFALWFFS